MKKVSPFSRFCRYMETLVRCPPWSSAIKGVLGYLGFPSKFMHLIGESFMVITQYIQYPIGPIFLQQQDCEFVVVKCELRVASCELLLFCELRVAS